MAYLLDTNHLGAAVSKVSKVRDLLQQRFRAGVRFATCIPVICELEAGFQHLLQPQHFRQRLSRVLNQVKIWPLDRPHAIAYGEIYNRLTRSGRVLSFVDLLLESLAKHTRATLLTTDRDFEALPDIQTENWLT